MLTNSKSNKFPLSYIFPGETYTFGKHRRHFYVRTMNKVACDAENHIIDFCFIKKYQYTVEISRNTNYIPICISSSNHIISELTKKKCSAPLILYKRKLGNKLKIAKYYI